MIDLRTVDEDQLGQTQKQIRKHVIDRGWQAFIPYVGSAHYFITRADGKELHIFSSTPPTTSYAAASLANDKFATYELLKDTNIPQLDTIKVSSEHDFERAVGFLHKHGKVVAKPIDGGHGNGITIEITDEKKLKAAIDIALKATKNVHAALIQRQYNYKTAYDLRLLYIGYEFTAAIQRVAARVFSDGVHTIEQLIEIENNTDRRGKAYHAPLATIDMDRASSYLGDRLTIIPDVGEEVQVIGVANYGAGGETVDVTDDIPDWLIAYGKEAAVTCGLGVAGVDFMLSRFPEKQHSEADLDVAMTEVNKAPLLTMHDSPTSGTARGAMHRYMDYLESLT